MTAGSVLPEETVTGTDFTVGVEMELLAPAGRSRRHLAEAIAAGPLAGAKGCVRRIFHPQSETSLVDGAPVMENLTLGFDVHGPDGTQAARCVDDLTLVDDLDPHADALPDWYRIISDDARLLELVQQHCSPHEPKEAVLAPLASLFGTSVELLEQDTVARVCDRAGRPIAMAVSLPGERQRPCELVTPPLGQDREDRIEIMLATASELGFSVPAEAATHIHFDGRRLKSPSAMAALIETFGKYRKELRAMAGTNPRCRRLGDWPAQVYRTIRSPGFIDADWREAATQLREAGAHKYCDFNFSNLLSHSPDKQTFEVRILPGTMDALFISRAIRLFEAMLSKCIDNARQHRTAPPSFADFMETLTLSPSDSAFWAQRRAPSRWSIFS